MKSMLAALSLLAATGSALAANPVVEMQTSHGPLRIELFEDKAPRSVANFLAYVRDGHYNGTIFHRVIDGFMIQGGGFEPGMKQKPVRDPIPNEAANGLKNDKGTLAMARTNDPHSATAQFFINVADNDFLNHRAPTPQYWGYAVFGRVTQGYEVVEKIARVPTTNAGFHQNVPAQPVLIQSVRVLEAAGKAQ